MDNAFKKEALRMARTLGNGDIENGAMGILKGTHWENNFEKLLGNLEVSSPGKKFYAWSPVSTEPPTTRSINDYKKWRPQFRGILSEAEEELLEKALEGDHRALINLLSQCPEYLLFQEITDHFISFLRSGHKAKPGTGIRESNKKLLQQLVPLRKGGKLPLVKRDIQMAYVALKHHYESLPESQASLRGAQTLSQHALKVIATELNVSEDSIRERIKDVD